MSTFLFDDVVFGPVRSRRLGVSLGINLLPIGRKICNFDCVYCECGLNNQQNNTDPLPTRQQVYDALHQKLSQMQQLGETPDVITFAGNGEPTIHPDFASIIDDTITLRNRFFPKTQVSVLSNSTMLHKSEVVAALKKIDQNILKLDSGVQQSVKMLNRPTGDFDIETLVKQLASFEGNCVVQTMFVGGEINGTSVDNTTEADLNAWELAISRILPKQVMIYTIARDTPYGGLTKISADKLQLIALRLKKYPIEVTVYE